MSSTSSNGPSYTKGINSNESNITIIREYLPYKPNNDRSIIILLIICFFFLSILTVLLVTIVVVYAIMKKDVPGWFANGSETVFQISFMLVPLLLIIVVIIDALMLRNTSDKQRPVIVGLSVANSILSVITFCCIFAITFILLRDTTQFVNIVPLIACVLLVTFSLPMALIPFAEKDD